MRFNTIYREEALARRTRREAVDARLQVTAPHEWLFVSGLGVALLVLLGFGLVGQAERGLSVDAVLVRPGERIDVVAGTSGVVVEVLAAAGETVAEGEPIARVRTPAAEGLASVLHGLRESLENGADPAAAEVLRALGGPLSGVGRPATSRRLIDDFPTLDILAPRSGVLATVVLSAGQRVGAGDLAARIRTVVEGPVEALGFVAGEDAARIAPGMEARVRLDAPGSAPSRMLRARVAEVSAGGAPPPWIAGFGLKPPPRGHLLRATLTEESARPVVDGAGGTLRIVLGRRSFLSLVFGNDRD